MNTQSTFVAKGQLLPVQTAQSVLGLLEVGEMGAGTFETEDEANAWFRRPHPMLEGDSPLQAAKTNHGVQRVKDILLAIRHGGVV